MKPAIVIQAGAGLIGRPLLDIPRIGILSLHHGIMPAIRGMDSILWSFVEDRPDWAGITVQLLDEGLDTGRILTQVSVWTAPRENPFSAVATATELGADLMARSIRAILASGGTNGWHSAEIGTYKSSLTPDAVRKLKHLCQVRGDDGIEADGSRSGTPQAKRWSQSMVATAVARGRRT
jgi:methionyl-tRNA formyltransferase